MVSGGSDSDSGEPRLRHINPKLSIETRVIAAAVAQYSTSTAATGHERMMCNVLLDDIQLTCKTITDFEDDSKAAGVVHEALYYYVPEAGIEYDISVRIAEDAIERLNQAALPRLAQEKATRDAYNEMMKRNGHYDPDVLDLISGPDDIGKPQLVVLTFSRSALRKMTEADAIVSPRATCPTSAIILPLDKPSCINLVCSDSVFSDDHVQPTNTVVGNSSFISTSRNSQSTVAFFGDIKNDYA